jgi:outer membrane lipoprotein-sorting protein
MNPNRHIRRQLRELAQISPEPDATRRAMARAKAAVVESSRSPSTNPWGFLMHHRRSAVAAVATLLAAAVLMFAMLSGGPRSAAFAQVAANIGRTRSVQYIEMHSTIPRGNEPQRPTTIAKVMILGRSLERKEVLASTEGDPPIVGHPWDGVTRGVTITDYANEKLVWLDVESKTFSEQTVIVKISGRNGKISESNIQSGAQVDFYARICDIPVDTAQRLPTQELSGRRLVGFRAVDTVNRAAGVDTWTRTFWVDPSTNLPVQIETTVETTDPQMPSTRWVMSDMRFDVPLDESLFSTDPPEGYTAQSE